MSAVSGLYGFAAVAIAVAPLASCTDPPAAGTPLVVRDSAGLEIVEILDDPWASPAWARIDTTTAMRIRPDDLPPGLSLARVQGLTRFSDGSIAVLDLAGASLSVFDGDGQLRLVLGRHGEAPGDLTSPYHMMRGRGDSVLVFDLFRTSAQVYSARGGYARSLPMQDSTGAATPPILLRAYDDGTYLAVTNRSAMGDMPREGVDTIFSTLFTLGADGRTMTTLGTHVARVTAWHAANGKAPEEVETLFASESGIADTEFGYIWCSAREFRCEVWSSEGRHHRSIRAQVPPRPIGEDDFDELVRQRLALADPGGSRREVESRLATARRPEHFPVFSRLLSDSRDRVWMQEYAWGTDSRTRRWVILAPPGNVLGTLVLPAGIEVFEIGEDYILGLESRNGGPQSVVLYNYVIIGS